MCFADMYYNPVKRYISKHVEVLDKIFSRIIGWMTLIWFVYMGIIAGITLYVSGRSGFSMKEAMLGSIILCLLILLIMLAFLAFVKIEEYTGRIRMQEREMQKLSIRRIIIGNLKKSMMKTGNTSII